MKKFLMALIARKKNEMADVQKRSDASQDLAEVRALGETLSKLRQEIEEAEAQLAKIEEDEANAGAGEGEGRSALVNAQVVGSFATRSAVPSSDKTESAEYRNAFMEFVCRGTQIPAELRDATMSADAGAVIPTTIVKEIVKNMESYGNVYALVRKLNVKGGVAIPVLSLKPTASWVGEASSDAQKLDAKTSISFSYFGLECKIAQSLLVSVTTIDEFQALFVPLATEAIVKALEIAIFNGNGTTQPQGIVNDTRVTNVVTMSPSEFASWSAWHTKVKAGMKKAYRDGVFFMNQATFDGYIDGMVDKQGQPIGRTNYGIDGEEKYRFMGKNVETVEDGCLPAYEDATVGDVVAVFLKPTDYVINSNLELTTVKWVDNDTNEIKNKCILICDGKLADANGVIIIKKGAEA